MIHSLSSYRVTGFCGILSCLMSEHDCSTQMWVEWQCVSSAAYDTLEAGLRPWEAPRTIGQPPGPPRVCLAIGTANAVC